MADTATKNGQPTVKEVGLTDWIKTEPEDAPEEGNLKREPPKQNKDSATGKRKRENKVNKQQTSTNKSQKTNEPQDNLPESEQNTLQYLTDDQFIMAYIKEEVVESSIAEVPLEAHSNQTDTCSVVPEIPDDPKSAPPPQSVPTESKPPEPTPKSTSSEAGASSRPYPKPRIIHIPPLTTPRQWHMCPHCKVQYANEGNLTRHIDQHHRKDKPPAHSVNTPIQCPDCPTTFTAISTYKQHKAKYHDYRRIVYTKQYVCRHCMAPFGEEMCLFLHLANHHTGLNPLICTLCSLAFDWKAQTYTHYRNEHKLLNWEPWQYTCHRCGQIVGSRLAQKQPCEEHPIPSPSHVSIKETLVELRSTAGPSLDNLAKKLGITPRVTETPPVSITIKEEPEDSESQLKPKNSTK